MAKVIPVIATNKIRKGSRKALKGEGAFRDSINVIPSKGNIRSRRVKPTKTVQAVA